MSYLVAVPSYARPEICRDKTLATLERMGVDKDAVTIFCATEDEREKYQHATKGDWRVIVSELGIANSRLWYNTKFYSEGSPILSIDDDIRGIYQKDGKTEKPCKLSIQEIIELGFALTEKTGAKLWGIYPVKNGMFMKDYVVEGLRYIGGGMFGSYAGDPAMIAGYKSGISSGEDYQVSLRSFITYGKVIRIEWLTWDTNIFSAGGIDQELKDKGIEDRQRDHRHALRKIAATYPELATTYKKAKGITNLRLKSITYNKYIIDPKNPKKLLTI